MNKNVHTEFVRGIAQNRGFKIDQTEAEEIKHYVQKQFEIVSQLDELNLSSATPPDRNYVFADEDIDPNNVFITICDIKEKNRGKLSSRNVGVKDNIAVAGIPMTCGSPALEHHIPHQDATVVKRILRNGGRITGKTNMDEFALGGDDSTMRFKTTLNPHSKVRHPGGSSLGSGVGVVEEEFDIGLGTDTGGSVRIPASWSGLFGLKPTWGSVPLDGVVQYSKTLDTVGVLASCAEECMRMFSVISGMAEKEPRDKMLKWDVDQSNFFSNLSIGLISDLFGGNAKIDAEVKRTLDLLSDRGVTITEVSIPDSKFIVPCWMAISTTEFGTYLDTKGVPYWSDSPPMFSLYDHLSSRSDTSRKAIGDHIRDIWMSAIVLREYFGEKHYAMARRFQQELYKSVESLFENVDILATPTVSMTPPLISEGFGDVSKVIENPGLFNLTGHPAISAPCGQVNNLPVGVQFISPYNREDLVCKIASCVSTLEST